MKENFRVRFNKMVVDKISGSSWIDKISGDKSRWFKANKLEEEGKLEEAVELYLKEADEKKHVNPGISGLCYLSAAKILMKTRGREKAEFIFRKAAESYEEYAEKALSSSPSSAIWGYKMASKCYAWSGEYSRSEEMKKIAKALSEKIEGGKKGYPLFRIFKTGGNKQRDGKGSNAM